MAAALLGGGVAPSDLPSDNWRALKNHPRQFQLRMNTPEETLQAQRKLSGYVGTQKIAVGLVIACAALAAFGLWHGESIASVARAVGSLLLIAVLMYFTSLRREHEVREKL